MFFFLKKSRKHALGFTMAELLISLLILAEIATFTIPKILMASQLNKSNAIAKETIGMISGAHQQLRLSGNLSSSTINTDLMQYMNYVFLKTSGGVDGRPNESWTTLACNGSIPCIILHNGAVLQFYNAEYFGGSNNNNYVSFTLDPDGVLSGNKDSLRLLLYYDGRVVTRNTPLPNSTSSGGGALSSCSNCDPAWFSW